MVQVVIVDDDFITQELLRGYLRRYGAEYKEIFEISVFYDGQEIAKNYHPKFDIILLDVKFGVSLNCSSKKRGLNTGGSLKKQTGTAS
jgi:CheY-like chemotaxis protein